MRMTILNYFIIFAKYRKKDIDKVVTALEELQNKMLICGYLDYQKCCEMFMAEMQKNREDSWLNKMFGKQANWWL